MYKSQCSRCNVEGKSTSESAKLNILGLQSSLQFFLYKVQTVHSLIPLLIILITPVCVPPVWMESIIVVLVKILVRISRVIRHAWVASIGVISWNAPVRW